MALDDIVVVTVTANSKTVSRKGFGIPAALIFHTNNLDDFREYTKASYPTNMTDDGFAALSEGVALVGKIFSQSPSPTKCLVGRRLAAFTQIVEITPVVSGEGFIHKVTMKGLLAGEDETASFTEGGAATVAQIVTGLESAINAFTIVGVTATDNTTEVSCAADVAGRIFSYTQVAKSLSLEEVTAEPGVATDFAALLAATTDFYGVCLDNNSPNEVEALAAVIEPQKVIFFGTGFSENNGDSGSTTDTAFILKAAAYNRTAFMWNRDALSFAGAAWLGNGLPADPGDITWAFKSLAGVAADVMTATFESALFGKNANNYTEQGGVNITYNGTMASGRFIDVTRTADWAEARVKEAVFGGLVNSPKIPFTDVGGSVIKGLVLGALSQGVKPQDSGAFVADPAPNCIVPKVADIPAVDKTARIFSGITWGATLTGAVHKTVLQGTLSV